MRVEPEWVLRNSKRGSYLSCFVAMALASKMRLQKSILKSQILSWAQYLLWTVHGRHVYSLLGNVECLADIINNRRRGCRSQANDPLGMDLLDESSNWTVSVSRWPTGRQDSNLSNSLHGKNVPTGDLLAIMIDIAGVGKHTSEIQWASSTPMRRTPPLTRFIISTNPSLFSRSGAQYNRRSFPSRREALISCSSSRVLVESIHSAAMPFFLSASTWSFIKAMRGETTMLMPESLRCLSFVWRSSSGNAIAGI